MPNDEKLRRFLSASAIGYGLSAVYMLVAKKRMEEDLRRLDRDRHPPGELWHSLGVAYMATIAAAAWTASRDRLVAKRFINPLLVAKGTTTALFAYRFARTRRASYAVSALTDGGLLATMAYLLARTRQRSTG